MPTSEDLSAFLGPSRQVDAEQATAVITIVTALARSYTRGNGFVDDEPEPDIAAVITTASARVLTHAGQVEEYLVHGPESARYGASHFGWSIGELAVLDKWRVTNL
ncbi:hypothetical protein [Mycolicibacterium pulveris]|uniref:hypothetical protein n=1 Tax=Mycolicibacterium pulveris TaxID=36813 RepID=UPI003CF5F9A1